ncbi:S-adenosyl-L-methionine-dependent methyltransferase [Kickxella alabastrina]|uniref:S-adenosyl-L-methionine-dependent methyltransferase n=1 Tax=Kickxella alabastrina TaxID=61397 RepID=UPI00221E75DE|nr:S-adenosyl-L-methionine-dependent methyltransferase [Kickxella alabastrina]KAI7834515.1 S-adenosyl-L-methionine-dependent methyltransferase [Kickxella alabastrina]
MGLATPDTQHLRDTKYSTVYEPAEDTYLLLDALENDQSTLHSNPPTICVEIGSGSGCVSAFLGQLLHPTRALILSIDINAAATEATKETTLKTNCSAAFEQCRTRFVQSMSDRLAGGVDVLLFNPPYVVTPSEEIDVSAEASAWAGGVDGREVLNFLLPMVPRLLSPGGRFYLVVIEQNKPLDIIRQLAEHGVVGERVLERRAGIEHLSILRFIKTTI